MNSPTDCTVTSLDDVLITAELQSRPAPPPNYEAEARALGELAGVMAKSPERIFQKLADTALELCRAGSAGISVWEPGSEHGQFRWHATAGDYARYLNGTMPRDFSPCGVVLDRNAPLLMADPVRFFPDIADLCSPVREVLLVPFYNDTTPIPIGTVWVVAHDPDRHFDAEDCRIITSLTKFAGAAILSLSRMHAAAQAETSRRESEERYRALVNATSDIVYSMSADWQIMQPLNGRGLVADNTEPIPDWLTRNIPPSEHPRVRDAIAEAIATRRMMELKHQTIRPDGTLGWTSSRAVPILDAQGNVLEWFGAATDITRRRLAEDELKDIRSRMEAALDAGAIGTWSWDVRADRFYGDASFARIFSLDPETVSGGPIAHIMESIHPDDRQRVSDLVNRTVAAGDRYDADYRVAQPDGSWKWVNARGAVQRDENGTPVLFPGVVIDITDRKQIESDLDRVTSEADHHRRHYEALLSSTPDLAYIFDLQYRFLYANEGLLRMWGKSWEEAAGKTCLELGYEPWHAEMHAREIDEVKRTRTLLRGEVPFTGTFGRRIYDYILVPVFDAHGNVEAVAGTTRDVTERKEAEDAVRDADRKKDDFIALLAHELRNPLAPIRTGLQVLKLAGSDAATAANARAMMDRQLTHMVRLIDDLLDVSRVTRNKMELRRARVTLAEVVGNAVEAAGELIESAGHDLTLDLPPEPIVLDADLTRLAQVFSNLLTNSAKYTLPGGKIRLAASVRDNRAVISVSDTGIGIPAPSLPTIFDMFNQVDRSIERSSGGLGIGLALVKGLVEMHGGTIVAESTEGRGSTFTVSIPLAPPLTHPHGPVSEQSPTPPPARRVLVVDDNRDGAESMVMMLKLMGNDVRSAHDGLAAVEAAENFRPQVILMDVGMPLMNGLDAARRIREQPWGKDPVIIAMTGWGQESDRQNSRNAGCDGHLVKPVDFTELEKLLKSTKK